MKEITLAGSFGDKKLRCRLYPSQRNEKLVLVIHGAYGNALSSEKYAILPTLLEQDASVLLYNSTRRDSDTPPNSYEERKAQFIGKTFEQEIEDLHIVFNYLKKEERIRESELSIFASSLGAILALELSRIFSSPPLLCTVGTGLFVNPDRMGASLFPARDYIEELCEEFRGTALLGWGEEDEVFSSESFSNFTQAFKKAKSAKQVIFPGVNHSFSLKSGEPSLEAFSELVKSFRALLQSS